MATTQSDNDTNSNVNNLKTLVEKLHHDKTVLNIKQVLKFNAFNTHLIITAHVSISNLQKFKKYLKQQIANDHFKIDVTKPIDELQTKLHQYLSHQIKVNHLLRDGDSGLKMLDYDLNFHNQKPSDYQMNQLPLLEPSEEDQIAKTAKKLSHTDDFKFNQLAYSSLLDQIAEINAPIKIKTQKALTQLILTNYDNLSIKRFNDLKNAEFTDTLIDQLNALNIKKPMVNQNNTPLSTDNDLSSALIWHN